MEFNELIDRLGHFGRFQRQQYFLLALILLSTSMQLLGNVFILAIPKHRCSVPGLTNDTYEIQDEQHARLVARSIPMTSSSSGEIEYSKCEVYSSFISSSRDSSVNGFGRRTNGSLEEFMNSSTLSTNMVERDNITQSCSHWVFDKSVFSLTAASQFSLVCGRELVRSHLVMALMSGQMVGSLFTGPLTDHFGRKTSLVVSLALFLCVSVASAFAFHEYVLATFYFLNGALMTCIGCSSYTLAMELVGTRWRHVAGILIFSFWAFGMALMSLLAFLIRDWTHLQLVISCPIVLYLSYHFLVKESARWLHSKGRLDDTKKILEEAAATNGVKMDVDSLPDLQSHTDVEPQSKLSVFRYPSMIARLLIISINWFVCSLTYYGLSLNIGSLSGNIFLNFFLAAVFEFLGLVVLSLILMKLGRKTIYCGSIMLAGSACLLTVFPVLYGDEFTTFFCLSPLCTLKSLRPSIEKVISVISSVNQVSATMWTVQMLANVGKFGISGAFGMAWMFTSELFPTSFRGSVMAIGSFFARLGAMSASYIAFMGGDGELQKVMPQIVFGASGLVVGFLALILPETRGRHLPQSVRDATQMGRWSRAAKTNPEDKQTSASPPIKPLIAKDVSL